MKLGGEAPGPMPQDGRAYVVLGGKWVAIAHDEADGVPASLELPDHKRERSEDNGAAKVI